eukprot:TRINITY_DN6081_c0_g1_i1.p1 TRINITY_DN6081_c0_g1~~TRINITY_DN6081_c0_g1_i1.p1  ORF type:complete len:600 (+),score=109.97 TRINITY_DN6081_c0_g1_i1:122-1921(+)
MESGSQVVKMSHLIDQIVQQTYLQLQKLGELLQHKEDPERKGRLIKFLSESRTRTIKLIVAVKWALNNNGNEDNNHSNHFSKGNHESNGNFIIKRSWEILELIEKQDSYFKETADALYYVHENLQNAKAPIYDVPTSIDVLTTGSYQRLPTSIEDVIPSDSITQQEVSNATDRLNQLIHIRLFSSYVPSQFTSIKIANGRATCCVAREFTVQITLKGELESDPWIIAGLKIHVASDEHIAEDSPSFNFKNFSYQLNFAKTIAQQRMIDSEKPLEDLFHVLHSFCISLQIHVLYVQASLLSRTKPSLGVSSIDLNNEKISIRYWASSTLESSLLEIYSEDSKIKIDHSPTIINPLNNQEVLWYIQDPDRLNVEMVLHQVIKSNIHMKLFRAYEALKINAQSKDTFDFYSRSQIFLNSEYLNTFLKVGLTENSSLCIRIDARTGLFIVKDEPPTFGDDFLHILEDRINLNVLEMRIIVAASLKQKIVEYYERAAYLARLVPSKKLPKKNNIIGQSFSDHTIYIQFESPYQDYYLAVDQTENFYPKLFLLKTKQNELYSGFIDIERVQPILEKGKIDNPIELKPFSISMCYSILKKIISQKE